ncbi:hypothetical protein [Nonomuraea sp. NPDC049784]|uniref:hypothetical protein n=1 Tax=Nonomuraea sp. NPDC049784 TaxID=3154361 RepID=UPI0033CE12FE
MASIRRSRRTPAGVAIALVVLGVVATAVRLDAPSDGGVVRLGWGGDGVVVDVPGRPGGPGLRDGDLVTGVAGNRLADGLNAMLLFAAALHAARRPRPVPADAPASTTGGRR